MQTSIARKLYVHLTLSLFVIWLGVVGSVAFIITHETEEIFDSSLQETAQRLLSLSVREFSLQQTAHHEPIAEPASHDEYLTYQLFNRNGEMLMRSHAAPESPLALPLAAGFHKTDDQHFFVESTSDGAYWIKLAERQHHRTNTLKSMLKLLLLPLGVLIPLSLFVIYVSVNNVRKPILSLDQELSRRDSKDLSPVDESQLPAEFLGLGKTLNSLMARLKAALDAERSFAANSAHELRTPIATAMAQLDVLRDEISAQPAQSRILNARNTLKRLEQMTVKLLQLARAESGIAFNLAPVELRSLIALLTHDLSFRSRREIVLDTPKHAVFIMGDIDAIGIVIQNLLENADRYAADGSSIEITLDEKGTLRIQNDCEPIPKETIAKLSDRFVRSHQHKAGSGIGLSIVRTILEQCAASWQLASPCTQNGRGFAVEIAFQAASQESRARVPAEVL